MSGHNQEDNLPYLAYIRMTGGRWTLMGGSPVSRDMDSPCPSACIGERKHD